MSFSQVTICYTTLLKKLCDDLDIQSCTRNYLLFRLKNEGVQFLTVTLPTLNSLVLRGLELGTIAGLKHQFSSFRWKNNALVHFNELICKLFDTKTGVVRVDLCEVALWRLRQLSLYFYKLSLEFSEKQLRQAEQSYLNIEKDLANLSLDVKFVEKIRKNIETYYDFPDYTDVLSKCRPRYGPGTFSTNGARSVPYFVEKCTSRYANGYMSKYSGISGYFKLIPGHKGQLVCHTDDTSQVAQVLFVPKDSRGPRVISREPLLALKMQMSFFDYFSRFFEKHSNYRINFTEQQINRDLAQKGSYDGSYSTIDLKEASDRVSFALVKKLSQNVPVLRYFLKSRTSEAQLPSGLKIATKKLAGMGSGLTFIWLALICHSSIATEISVNTGRTFAEAASCVYVYGDDVIVPSAYTQYAFNALKKVGLIPNENKSFYRKTIGTNSTFRESCGGDFYAGKDVGVSRLKMQNCGPYIEGKNILFDKNKNQAAISDLTSHARELAINGLLATSEYLYSVVEHRVGKLPLSRLSSSYLTRFTRKYFTYAQDATGTYDVIKTHCYQPEFVEASIDECWHYAKSLSAKVAEVDFLHLQSASTGQFDVAVPRNNVLRRSRVSSFIFSI